MKGPEAIAHALKSTHNILMMFLNDLSDDDLLVRPVPNANHTAWQLGHLLLAEHSLLSGQLPGVHYTELPSGFAEQHRKETASQEPAVGFLAKSAYLELLESTRQATIQTVLATSEEVLDTPSAGPVAAFAPKLGDLILLCSNHTLMHAGQVTVIRRKLGKPVLF